MSAAENLLGRVLHGARRGNQWRVTEKLSLEAGLSPGHFSVGYIVEDENRNQAFMKASDLGMFTRDGADFLTGLQRAVGAHAFERQILDHCHGNRMDRVVTALDYGDIDIVHHGTRDHVFFLVFEKAQGDLRGHVEKTKSASLLWSVTALHNFFVAVSQLHSALVAHNDIKPANALVFDDSTQKIADLGRATSSIIPAAHDSMLCAGDKRFAPPEQLYPRDLNCTELPMSVRREAGDLYNLGSIAHYIVTSRMVTPEIVPMLRPELRPRNLAGGSKESYQAALPYWRDAFDQLVARMKGTIANDFGPGVEEETSLLVEIVSNLCEPDPLLRGHPRNRSLTQNRYGLERYITSLDHTKRRLAIKAA